MSALSNPVMRVLCASALAAFLALGGLPVSAQAADQITLKKGLWNFETTSVMSMMPEPKTGRSSECIRDDRFDPLAEMTKGGDCKIQERSRSGQTLKWKMLCSNAMGGPPMEGSGEMTSTGDSVTGKMVSRIDMAGSPIEIDITWKGRFAGPCK